MKLAAALSVSAMLAISGSALAGGEIASQDFNGLSDSGGPSFDNSPTGSTLTNSNSMNSGGGGMDF